MKRILTTEQMQQADQAAIAGGIPAFDLMQSAGRAVANTAQRVAPDTGRMVIVVGSGNNGGDGYAAARRLSQLNVRVTVIALTDPSQLTGAAAEHAELAEQAGAKIRPVCNSEDSEMLTFWLNRACWWWMLFSARDWIASWMAGCVRPWKSSMPRIARCFLWICLAVSTVITAG